MLQITVSKSNRTGNRMCKEPVSQFNNQLSTSVQEVPKALFIFLVVSDSSQPGSLLMTKPRNVQPVPISFMHVHASTSTTQNLGRL